GSDGGMWFTESAASQIGRIDPHTGAISELALPTPGEPDAITASPDGNLWFRGAFAQELGQINPATSTITEVALPSGDFLPFEGNIAVGPDGDLWFIDHFNGFSTDLSKINPSRHVITDVLPHVSTTGQLTTGSDGNIWLTAHVRRVGSVPA